MRPGRAVIGEHFTILNPIVVLSLELMEAGPVQRGWTDRCNTAYPNRGPTSEHNSYRFNNWYHSHAR